jgi:hypothetical protein
MNEISPPFRYKGGYLGLLLPTDWFSGLPQTIVIGGYTLVKKEEFHVTIANIGFLTQLLNDGTDAEERFMEAFNMCRREVSLSFGNFKEEFRNAVRDERSSLVVRCTILGLEEIFSAFDKEFEMIFERQPAHVTLYTLQPGKGVGINTEAQMQACLPMKFPELFLCFRHNL